MRIQTREGAELTVDAGQFYEIPAGHEAWVEGDEPYINLEWQPSVAFGEAEGGDFDRIVATLLVTDIVDSTARALELGDGAWRDLLARHDVAVRSRLDRFRGREVTTTGDGFVACSTARSGRSVRRRRSVAPRRSSASRFAPASTPARSSWRPTTFAASASTSRRGSRRWPARARSMRRGRRASCSPARTIGFTDRGLQELKGLSERVASTWSTRTRMPASRRHCQPA